MSEQRKDEEAKGAESPPGAPSAGGAGRGAGAGNPRGASRRKRGWIYAKRPVLGFVLLFAVLLGVFYAVTFVDKVNMEVFPAYMRFNARASVAVINLFDEGAKANGTRVWSRRFSVDILHGCDAIAPTALFVAAVLAFPASFLSKIPGVVVGALVLAVVNLIRIIALFFTGIHFPRAFEAMHVDVWQPVFILLSLMLWVSWAWWATRSKARRIDVSSQKN